MRRVSEAVRLLFWSDVARQTLALGFEGLGIWGGLRREPAGNRGLGVTGWGYAAVGMEEGSRGRPGWRTQPLRSLTVREVSFGGVWPGSRVRYDEGGHSVRFRLWAEGIPSGGGGFALAGLGPCGPEMRGRSGKPGHSAMFQGLGHPVPHPGLGENVGGTSGVVPELAAEVVDVGVQEPRVVRVFLAQTRLSSRSWVSTCPALFESSWSSRYSVEVSLTGLPATVMRCSA